ncbi:MAG: arginine--tRNA ligase [Candidatus Aenigmarchaeota archaeon ex4484_52]|nr:MAG: arginine--tRNA ligase [Candidatus Aenigmarchaeota archaeon ex4484_52]
MLNDFIQNTISKIKKNISKILGIDTNQIDLIIPEKQAPYDIAFCCGTIAKILKKNPVIIAKDICINFRPDEIIEKTEQKNIYVNFFFCRKKIVEKIIKEILNQKKKTSSKKTIIIEYPCVNPGKPLHIGHCRNALLGASLSKIFEYCGYDVLKMNYIDDLGLQAACIDYGFSHLKDEFPKKENYAKKEDQWQGRLYSLIAQKMKTNKKIEQDVRKIMLQIEQRKNKKIIEIHNKLVEKCILAQYQTLWRLGIYHNIIVNESDLIDTKIYDKAIGILKKNKNIVFEAKGKNKDCLVAKLNKLDDYEKMSNPDKVLIRSDGTSTYIAKDIALHFYKFNEISNNIKYKKYIKQPNNEYIYSIDLINGKTNKKIEEKKEKVVNVIGSEQIYTQKAMYDIMKLCGYEDIYNKSIHIAYEHVWFKEMGEDFKFSGRSGNWIGYSTDEVLDKAKEIALNGVIQRQKKKTSIWQNNIAELLGCSAVKYAMLKTSWKKKIKFDWDAVMDMHGDSACYLLYSYARAKSILKKAGINNSNKSKNIDLKNIELPDAEYNIFKKLLIFDLIVQKAKHDYAPNIIANYCFEISNMFNSFYAQYPVLNAEENIRNLRLALCFSFAEFLKKALSLLVIDCAEEI